MKRTIAIATLSLLISGTAFAQTIEEREDGIKLTLGNDVYEAGNIISVGTNSPGDITVAGNQISVAKPIGDDFQAAGSSISVNALVGDDVRLAGGNIHIGADVRGDGMIFGGNITLAEGTRMGGSLLVAGGNVTIDGNVNGNIKIDADTVTINGNIRGKADISAQKVTVNGTVGGTAYIAAREIVMGDTGEFYGDLRYWTPAGAQDLQARGTSAYDETLAKKAPHANDSRGPAGAFVGLIAAVTLFSILSSALIILLLQLLTKNFFIDSAKIAMKRPWKAVLWGLLYFIVTPVLALLFMITLIGLPVGLVIIALYVVSIILVHPIVAIILARATELYRKEKWHFAAVFFASLGYFVVLKLISVIPVVGWIACALVTCGAYGAVLQAKHSRYKKIS